MQMRLFIALLGLGLLFSTVTHSTSNLQREVVEVNTQVDTTALNQVAVNPATIVVDDNPIVIRTYTARASWYRHGRITANGERYNPLGLTVAHKRLPFGTMIRFTNPETGDSIVARVNDRGPYIRGREYDLSLGSARALNIVDVGVVRLRVEILRMRDNPHE